MKLLKKQLLFTLARGVDFWTGVEKFEYFNYEQLYWRLKSYQKVSVRCMVAQLIDKGLVDKILRGRVPKFRLTKVGKEQLTAFFPATNWGNKNWDLTWRIIILNRGKLEPKRQRKLRKILDKFGFAILEKGIYVSPLSVCKEIKSILVENGFLDRVRMLETKRFIVGDDQSFASQVWRLDTIYNKYKTLITQLTRVLYRARRDKGLTDQLKNDYRFALSSWFFLLLDDPGLPKKLFPSDWPRLEAINLMDKLGKAVGELELEASLAV